MVAFNYAVRILTILVGFFFLSGKLFYEHPYQTELQVIGGLLIIWGIFRLYTYSKALKQLKEDEQDESEN